MLLGEWRRQSKAIVYSARSQIGACRCAWILLASVFGIGTAQAADLPLISQGGGSYMSQGGSYTLAEPASPLVVYDFEPGVVIRAYWLPPWRDRHFFPATGRAPVYGRREYLAPDGPPEPAEFYYRSRSTSSPVLRERMRLPEQPLK